MNIDVLDVINAANSLPKGGGNVNILTPSVGVGGYCLTKDPWFVHSLGKKLGLDLHIPAASRTANDKMPEYSASVIDSMLCANNGDGSSRKNKKIAIMGISFKNNTGDCRFTPVKPVIDELVRLGYQIEICDPWVMPHDAKLVTNLPVSNDIEKTLSGADCAAFLAGHRDFQGLSVDYIAEKVQKGALIFDGRMFWNKDVIQKMKDAGLRYKGVGR
jgi:UDP-N-acetyl-D-mannosaminuronic acid dehydrogenase